MFYTNWQLNEVEHYDILYIKIKTGVTCYCRSSLAKKAVQFFSLFQQDFHRVEQYDLHSSVACNY